MLCNRSSLWAATLLHRYFYHATNPHARGSFIWNDLLVGWHLSQPGIRWLIGDDTLINSWSNSWIGSNQLLRQCITGPLPCHALLDTISTYLTRHQWDFANIPFELPSELLEQILNTYIPSHTTNPDSFAWTLDSTGTFTTKSLYHHLLPTYSGPSFNWLWKLRLPPKSKHFLWLISYNRLPTRSHYHHTGFLPDDTCALCLTHFETITHSSTAQLQYIFDQLYPWYPKFRHFRALLTPPLLWLKHFFLHTIMPNSMNPQWHTYSLWPMAHLVSP